MKKLLTLTSVVLVASASFAANINWTISGVSSKVCNNYTGSAISSTVYLIIADNVSTLTGHTTEAAFLSALSALTLNDDYSTSDGKKPSVSGERVSSTKLTAGTSTTFGLLVYSTDSDGNGYYRLGTASETPWADGTDARDQKTVSTSWATMANSNWVSAWTLQQEPVIPDDPTPGVPEPATGALALAGVALLFKRRRA